MTAPERNDMKYELLIIWTTGETNTYKCDTKEKAEEAEGNMRMAFGNQIAWSCIREER